MHIVVHLLLSFFTSLVLFLPCQLLASDDIRFERYYAKGGVASDFIFDVVQDHYGFMWFATGDGLSRFDGIEFKTYRHNSKDHRSLSANLVWSLYIDSKRRLWVGTLGGGLNRFDYANDSFIRYQCPHKQTESHKNSDNHDLSNNKIRAIVEGPTGYIWLGTEKGLKRLDSDSCEFRSYTHNQKDSSSIAHNFIRDVAFDSQGRLWVAMQEGGVSVLDVKGQKFSHIKMESSTGLTDEFASAIYFDNDNNLWIGTYYGLNQLKNGAEFPEEAAYFKRYYHEPSNPKSLSDNRILSLSQDNQGRIWVGTESGLNIWQEGKGFTQITQDAGRRDGLSGQRIFSIYEDNQYNLWFATESGVNKINSQIQALQQMFKVELYRGNSSKSISGRSITKLFQQNNGLLWIGTTNGLNKKLENGEYKHFKHDSKNISSLRSNFVYDVLEDKRGNLWVATRGGLSLYRPQTESFEHFNVQSQDSQSLSIYAMLEGAQGNLWLGTENGLKYFDITTQISNCYLCGSGYKDEITNLLGSTSGDFWIGTIRTGLIRFNPVDKSYKRYLYGSHNINNSGVNRINDLYEDKQQILWLATGNGLIRFDPVTGSSKLIELAELGQSQVVYNIEEDNNGNLWLGNLNGIVRYNPVSHAAKFFGRSEGLDITGFSWKVSYKGNENLFYFGGNGGYVSFNPDDLKDDALMPNVLLTDFLLANKVVSVNDLQTQMVLPKAINQLESLTLDYQQNFFSLEFAALNISQPVKTRYTYQLKGFDDDWISTDADNRRATYTSLPAGDYTFTVKASNSEGIWNEQGKSLKIKILPAPWLSWWAKAFYALVVLSISYYFIHSLREKIKNKDLLLKQMARVDQLKDDFLANTSHELRTPLNGIIGLAESLIDGVAGEQTPAGKHNLSLVVTSGRRLSNLVNDILDFSKLKSHNIQLNTQPVDLHTLVDVVLVLSKPLLGDKKLELVNDVLKDSPLALADEDRVQQVLHNLVGNAVKFTDAGKVEVAIKVLGQWLEVSVTDTGVGIGSDKFARIFESFEQADGSETRQRGGTGLGLAVSRQLVALHGGEIKVESTVGKGSTFSFTLPLADSTATAATSSAVAKLHHFEAVEEPLEVELAQPNNFITNPANFKILLVDDEPINLQVLNNHLAAQSYQLVKAASGEQALGLIEQGENFDLVLLDIMMPKLSGYQVCESIRSQYPINDLPVIFLTAKNQVNDLVKSYQVGANDYLAKPVAKHELLSRVETQLRLLDINRHLEQKVKNRTEELLHAEKMASLGTLTAGVAHEINNPNNFIHVSMQNMNADLDRFKQFLLELVDDDDDEIAAMFNQRFEPLYKHVSTSMDGSERIKTIVQDLRTFTQLDNAEQKEVVVTDLIQSTVNLIKAKYVKLIDFDLKISDQPTLYCYPAQLNQVFMNIIVNACHAIESSMLAREVKGKITIGCVVFEKQIQISIKDDGCGMDKETKTKLSEPFFYH